tara:strand:+ start:1994 stop:3481 length:1488 start_codon:yes stop_codon:yes gene_type:complete
MEPKNIDRLFQEKLKDLELTPNPAVWNKIEASLIHKNKKRRALIWFRLAGIAAVAILGVFIYNNNLSSTNTQKEIIEKTITDSETRLAKPALIEESVTHEFVNKKHPINKTQDVIVNTSKISKKFIQKLVITTATKEELFVTQSKNKKTIPKKNQPKSIKDSKTIFEQSSKPSVLRSNTGDIALLKKSEDLKELKKTNIENILEEENQTPITENSITIFEDVNNPNESNPKTENIAYFKKTKTLTKENKIDLTKVLEIEKDEKIKRTSWAIAPTVSQLFSNTLSNNSSIDSRLDDATKKGNNSTSFGLKVAYRTSNKWQFQTGLHLLELAQTTQNIQLASAISGSYIGDSHFSSNITDAFSLEESSTKNASEIQLTEEGNINQTYGYLEVPLEVKYALFQSKKIEFHLIGGFSTLFLTKNNLQIESDNFSYSAGEATNLSKVNFTLNFGTNVEYHFNKNWYLDLSPMIKLQTNTFETQSNNPYFFGIYTGLNYMF